jgi:prepilin-type N-terminal cleavage/methylation domain-containing protein
MTVAGTSRDERGMTLIELSVAIVILGIIMSLAVGALLRARLAANEGSAIAGLRAISRAQFQYQTSCGNGLYARSLTVLGTKPAGESEAFLPGDLGTADTPTRSGYTYSMSTGAGGAAGTNDCNGVPTLTRYYAAAVPAEPGSTGTRGFATSDEGTLWQSLDTTAPTQPFGPPAAIVQ